MFCDSCGYQNHDGASFCSKCGEESWKRKDIDQHMQYHATALDSYFGNQNVTAARVRQDKLKSFNLYTVVNRYALSDVVVKQETADAAVAEFKKTWDLAGRAYSIGAAIDRLNLRRIGDQWKIISEEDVRVLWVDNGSQMRNSSAPPSVLCTESTPPPPRPPAANCVPIRTFFGLSVPHGLNEYDDSL
jgi:hypothetical protein